MLGLKAFFGFLEFLQCKPLAKETVVISARSGAVGSLVGRIAKIQGCKVIGICGGNEKYRLTSLE